MRSRLLLALSFLFLSSATLAQDARVFGFVRDTEGNAVTGVNVIIPEARLVLSTDTAGFYEAALRAGKDYTITYRHVQYRLQNAKTRVLQEGEEQEISVTLEQAITVLNQVEIRGINDATDISNQVSTVKLQSLAAKNLPSPFGEFTKVLTTLAGVSSNNELSASYSVRGGSFDENLIYVDGMPIYRPFLVRAGQQEGLSFINSDMVSDITFSAGGWQPKYGDKLSSVLNISYKKPTDFAGSATLGLLGGALHIENATANKRINYQLGVRNKSSRYLLNTLETQGQYLPRFTDVQMLVNFNLSEDSIGGQPVNQLSLIGSYARNRYLVEPETRETRFGTIRQVLRLFVAFEGRELLEYDTWQGGTKWSRRWNGIFKTDFLASGMVTREREYFEVEGGYRLCDVNTNPGSDRFNQCVVERGVGTNYDYGRNQLEAKLFNAEVRNSFDWSSVNRLEFGAGATLQDIEDGLNEFEFTDSAGFITIDRQVNNDISLNIATIFGYVQNTSDLGKGRVLTIGSRFTYWDFGKQWLVSPRLQYAFSPQNWERPLRFRMAAGVYQQPPFYRELRDQQGQVQTDVKAQSSIHFIAGADYDFEAWGRPFVFSSEAYYKHLYNVIPYDVDNVRLRYFASNNAVAYATGIDFRVNGEFIPGTESWFSLGLLQTKEDVEGDGQGYIRRPTDQRINLAVYFEDHFPNDPSIRVNLGLFYGSGLPFSPPDNENFRAAFRGDPYQRVDVGFSKVITYAEGSRIKSLWIGLDILNLLGADNPISYTWIKDVRNVQFAVPNSLSARFFNIKARVDF